MQVNLLVVIIVFAFLVVLCVVMFSDSLASAMLIVSLLANSLVITSQFHGLTKLSSIDITIGDADEETANTIADKFSPPTPPQRYPADGVNPFTDIYGPEYERYHAYHGPADDPASIGMYRTPVGISCSDRGGVDANNVNLWQRRARDKRCTDGWASKDANYFRHHYAKELDDTENRVWWGRDEY